MSMWMIFAIPHPYHILMNPALTLKGLRFNLMRMQTDYPDRKTGLLMAVLCGLCWAVLAIGLKYALNYADSETIVWFRLAFGFLFLLLFFLWKKPGDLRILWAPPVTGLIAGAGLAVNYVGFMKGVEYTSPSNAQVFIQLAPVLLILVGILVFKERVTRTQVVGFTLAAIGFALFYKDQFETAISFRDRYLLGNGWILLAAVTWVVFAAIQKVLVRTWNPHQINLMIFGLATVALVPLVNFETIAQFDPWIWFLMSALGLNTLIAYGALGVALQKAPATDVSMIITLNPLLTLALMAGLDWIDVTWIEPDEVHGLGYFAALVVVAGVILAVRRTTNQARPTSR